MWSGVEWSGVDCTGEEWTHISMGYVRILFEKHSLQRVNTNE